jgi:hypothetical protein
VTARVDGALCGQSATRVVGGQSVFVVDVAAAGAGELAGCGVAGRTVVVQAGAQELGRIAWDNGRPRELKR